MPSNSFSAAIDEALHQQLAKHLLREDGHEDLTFAVYYPSKGATRYTAILHAPIWPEPGERHVHGNASFEANYFERAARTARAAGGGLAFMHSHPFPGWQGMSRDDYRAEAGHAAAAQAITGIPLVGLTLGIDGAWSARTWTRVRPKTYEPTWADNVRVVGKALSVTWNPDSVAPYLIGDEINRTVSFWGDKAQADLGRLNIGIIGLGSVGSIVAESLARTGIRHLTLIDFDKIEPHNLDRTAGANKEDATRRRPKVEVAERNTKASATAQGFRATSKEASITQSREGYLTALDCDVLFSCVDRPWPRRILNHIAYAHLIPVIDGGIIVRHSPAGRFKNANWGVRTSGPGRACLECTGAYDAGVVSTEQQGLLDNPSYMASLPQDSPLRRRENVHAVSMAVASFEIMQLVALVAGLVKMHDVGEQRYSYYPGIVTVAPLACDKGCPHTGMTAKGSPADDTIGNILPEIKP